jgi:hypothetical protein
VKSLRVALGAQIYRHVTITVQFISKRIKISWIGFLVFVVGVSGCAGLTQRFSCWDEQRWVAEGSYEYFADNTLKECENPAGNGFQLGIGMIAPDTWYTIRSCEQDSPQTCMDKQGIIYANTAQAAIAAGNAERASEQQQWQQQMNELNQEDQLRQLQEINSNLRQLNSN